MISEKRLKNGFKTSEINPSLTDMVAKKSTKK